MLPVLPFPVEAPPGVLGAVEAPPLPGVLEVLEVPVLPVGWTVFSGVVVGFTVPPASPGPRDGVWGTDTGPVWRVPDAGIT